MSETEFELPDDAAGLSAPRSARQLVHDAFRLYRTYPRLFFVLASGVIVPYEVIVLASTGAGPFAHGSLSVGVGFLLMLIELALIGPLVSALHVQAVKEVAEGRKPRQIPIARRGLRVLPVVAAATIIAWLGMSLGLVLLVVPGVILWLRWLSSPKSRQSNTKAGFPPCAGVAS